MLPVVRRCRPRPVSNFLSGFIGGYRDARERQMHEQFYQGYSLEGRMFATGMIPRTDVCSYLALTDISSPRRCSPRDCPSTVLEAMAAGKPIIASRVGGIARLIEHEENGLLVDPSDSQQIRAALERLIDSPELCRRLGAAARALVSQRNATAETADWRTAYSAAMSR